MNVLKKYGRQMAIICIAIGLVSLISAIFLFSTPFSELVWVQGEDRPVVFSVDNAIAANWLMSAGIHLFPGDSIYFSGIKIEPSFAMPEIDRQMLLYKPAFPVTLTLNDSTVRFFSSAPTLGAALWEKKIGILFGDKVSIPLKTPLTEPLTVSIQRGQKVRIKTGEHVIEILSAADTVGDALASAGILLQDKDYSSPSESEPMPQDRSIEITRVSEEIIMEESVIPFTNERITDASLNAGQEKILQSGQDGMKISTIRVRYENDKETLRTKESEWILRQPISQKTAYGSNIVVQSSTSADCPVDYWLSKEVYVTSYRDTGSPTATGIWPYYGAIAVSPEWFSILRGSSICVPGYGVGTVVDVCPGCSGKPWVDVFIPTADYVSWSKNLTVYFLPPAPAGFSGDLP